MSSLFLSQSIAAVQEAGLSAYNNADELKCALRTLGQQLGWGNPDAGAFANVIPAGARVLVKPNLVLHENHGPWSFDAVITHPSLVRAAVSELLLTGLSEIHIGDAPIQSCNLEHLLQGTGLDSWAKCVAAEEPRFTGIRDFRRTTATFDGGIRVATEDKVDLGRYALFDLGRDSLLEPVTTAEPRFRVTCYDPKFLASTHAPGRHQYVINLPKLKMHKKAGITNALKNLVGINGNKEYLPHHRIGGSNDSGDCYPGKSRLKETIERLYDFQNTSPDGFRAKMVAPILRPLVKFLSIAGDETGIEGSWSGNDTVWRMSLDLNRILIYGKPDGTMSDVPQRMVMHICDGIMAGQGNGPLAPEPFNLKVILAGNNPVALDYVGAYFLGLDPMKIPIVTGAFQQFRWPLAQFSPDQVVVKMNEETQTVADTAAALKLPTPQSVPVGWVSVAREIGKGAVTAA
jgi:uncharacterized protein (DUF362 family)